MFHCRLEDNLKAGRNDLSCGDNLGYLSGIKDPNYVMLERKTKKS